MYNLCPGRLGCLGVIKVGLKNYMHARLCAIWLQGDHLQIGLDPMPFHAQEAPLLKQLLSSSGPEQEAERLWLARLLGAGFRGQQEGDTFRCVAV